MLPLPAEEKTDTQVVLMPALFFKNLLPERNKDFAGVVLSPAAAQYRAFLMDLKMKIRQFNMLQ